MYRGGMSLSEVALAFGRSSGWVALRLRRAGVTLRPKAPRKSLNVQRMRRLYESGMTLEQVAADAGASRETVRRRLSSIGVEIRRQPNRFPDPPAGHLWCTVCRECLPESAFGRSETITRGYAYDCKQCARERHLAKKYGIGREDFARMMRVQDGRCAICKETLKGKPLKGFRAVHVDHCHESGDVRQLLCGQCNAGLGNFKDDPERLRRAARYMSRPDQVRPTRRQVRAPGQRARRCS